SMDNWIASNIEDELECAREKRYQYNISRNRIQKQAFIIDDHLDDYTVLQTRDNITNKEMNLLGGTELMDVDAIVYENEHESSVSTTLGYSSINEITTCDAILKDNENSDDDDDFQILDAYETFFNSDTSDSSSDEQEQEEEQQHSGKTIEHLHSYTNMTTSDVCSQLINLLRNSQVSKSQTKRFLSFIRNILPTPNNFPNTMAQLLSQVDIPAYFDKRIICSLCVFIYDTHFSTILSLIITRLYTDIEAYTEKNRNNDNTATYDIPFAATYQNLLKWNKKKLLVYCSISMELACVKARN
ncbi:unnamed protein product, partial [Rotaria sp. Silwood2]